MWKKIPPGTTSAPGATSASGIWTVDPDWGCPLWRDELNRANAHFPSTGMNAVGFLPTWRGASAHRRLPSRAMAATHRAWKSTSIVRPGASTTRTTAPPTAEGGSRASFPSSEGRALSLMMRMDLNKTVGGTRLTLYANLPKGQKITTYARFEAEQAASQSQQPKPHQAQQRPSRSAPRRHGSPAAVRPKPSSLSGTPQASGVAYASCSSNEAKAPMPRTSSVPKATARLPRVASQGKAPVHSRTVATPRVRKNSLECGSVFDAPRLTRQRTGETAADSPEPPTVASPPPPPPTVASPLPDRRSGLSDGIGAVFIRSPPATIAVAPRALRPPLAPFSLEPPKTRGAPAGSPPTSRPAATPAVVPPAPASALAVLPRASAPARMSPRAPLAEACRLTRLGSLRAKAAVEAAAEEEAEATVAVGWAPTLEPVLGLRRKADPGTQSGGSPLRLGFQRPPCRPPRSPPPAEAGGSPTRLDGLHAGRETSSRPRVRAWHEAATAAARFALVLPSAVSRVEVAAKAVGGAPPVDTAESLGGGGGSVVVVGGGGGGGGGCGGVGGCGGGEAQSI